MIIGAKILLSFLTGFLKMECVCLLGVTQRTSRKFTTSLCQETTYDTVVLNELVEKIFISFTVLKTKYENAIDIEHDFSFYLSKLTPAS